MMIAKAGTKAPLIFLLGSYPFIGRSSTALNNLIQSFHSEANFYFSSLVNTPMTREPTDLEIEEQAPRLKAEFASLEPEGVMMFGRTAQYKTELVIPGVKFDSEERHFFRMHDDKVWCSTFHPSFASRGNKQAEMRIKFDLANMINMTKILKINRVSRGISNDK